MKIIYMNYRITLRCWITDTRRHRRTDAAQIALVRARVTTVTVETTVVVVMAAEVVVVAIAAVAAMVVVVVAVETADVEMVVVEM